MFGILATIALLNSDAIDLYREYLLGGSATQRNLTGRFHSQFTASADTMTTTAFLADSIVAALRARPPLFPTGTDHLVIDVPSTIPGAVAAIDDCASPHAMSFTHLTEVPGLIAGGVGSDQSATLVGAVPSTYDDRRHVEGRADLHRLRDGSVLVIPRLAYTVEDTLDFCPGNCGGWLGENIGSTNLMSRLEASGVSGDIPFKVTFDAPTVVRILPPPVP